MRRVQRAQDLELRNKLYAHSFWGGGVRGELGILLLSSSKLGTERSGFRPEKSGGRSREVGNVSGFRVQGSGFRVQGFQGSGFRVQGAGFRVQGFQGSGVGSEHPGPCSRRRTLNLEP